MPPYYAFRDPQTGETFTREMTDEEYASFPDPSDVLNSRTLKLVEIVEAPNDAH